MTTGLATTQPADLAAPLDKARAYAEQATSPSTLRRSRGWALR